jgi:hypothetical protein
MSVNEPLLMLNFVGLYFLLLSGLVYNFYHSQRLYTLLALVAEVLSREEEINQEIHEKPKSTLRSFHV